MNSNIYAEKPEQHEENKQQEPGWGKRLLGYMLVGMVVFTASFWVFQQAYQQELDTVQADNLTEVRILSMNTFASRSGETTHEIIFFDNLANTFRVNTSQGTYERLSLGQQTSLYFNEPLSYALLDGEMTKFGIELWIIFLLLFTVAVLLLFFGVGRIFKRFKKRGRPERPLSEL